MEATKRTETTFRISAPTPKGVRRIHATIKVAGEVFEATLTGTYREDEARALITKLQKGK